MRTKLMLAALLIGWSSALPMNSIVQSQRGLGVRINSKNGQEIDLYNESHALVIGVRKYTNGWRELPGVEKDVEAVSAVLRNQGFQVKVALNPTSAQLNEALNTFVSDQGLQERNRLLFYFAGHGHTEELADGRELGYIVPADAPLPGQNPQLFNRRAISMDDIEAKALRIRSKHALFIFDSCFSGSIFEVRGERYVPPEIESKTAAPVRMFITAGTKNQTVPDDSVFRLYFVRAFEEREGDLNRDGFITGEELGMYLAGRVTSDSRDTQTPRYGKIKNARLNLGDMVFALPGRTSPPPQVAPAQLTAPAPRVDPAALELALWQSADRSNDIADYEEYLRQYPQGQFAGIARNRVSKSRKDTPNPVSQAEDFQITTWHVHDNLLALALGAGTITISPKDKTVNFQETGGDLNVKHNFSAPCSNIKTPKIAVKTEYNYSVQPAAKTDHVTLRLEVNGKGYNFMNGKTQDEQRGHALAIQEKIVKVCIYDKN
jgi:caspase domain-containing protein